MTSLEVLRPGLFTTVQDLGREGYGRLGVPPAGAADPLALRLANLLAGNPEGAAGIEMTLVGGVFRFEGAAVAALGGADLAPALDGEPRPAWEAFEARAGQTLACGVSRSGARAYLAVRGGVAVPRLLGSASTHALSGMGGLEGRALRAGDRLPIGDPEGGGHGEPPRRPAGAGRLPRLDPGAIERLAPRRTLRVTPGPQAERFPPEARAVVYGTVYRVSEESDRMGLRLLGAPIGPPSTGRMVTEGVPLGAVQVPPDGGPIILFVDRRTTGGYPVIASVISADLWRVGQLRPRDEVRFEPVSVEAARALLLEQEAWLRSGALVRR